MLSIDAWLDEKPYKEIFDGAIHPKVSPRLAHGIVALRVGELLKAWGGRLGAVSVEWRVYLAPGTSLVPDVAFASDERLEPLTEDEIETLPFAPDITVEVRSPEDRESRIVRKTGLYLQYGATIVLNINPIDRTVQLTSRDGERILRPGEFVEHPAFPGLRIPVAEIFAPLDRKRKRGHP